MTNVANNGMNGTNTTTSANTNGDGTASSEWTFLSNHAHVFLVIARDPEIRLRDVSDLVGITERAVQRIVTDLEIAGFLTRERTGRRNRYKLHIELPLRHSIESHRTIGDLLKLILTDDEIAKLRTESSEKVEVEEEKVS